MAKGFHQSGFEIGMVLFGTNKYNYGYSEDELGNLASQIPFEF